ncbi:Argininosuccinate lyase [Variovorax sp. PBS-H4]|uniref:Bug family tripartite tricarboxylate transporter substrate binding protein n=1 Tax=Variovorax sp. PBS-H4 TaxID=434008 RepID=UPI001316DE07|nr:tripartite tricarboxylate transporter substrate binding protein [Variovorax sp. PBS-H4]VTU36052.1 Argininosuccinate lyase [Variovorax sp. PBS-H4]
MKRFAFLMMLLACISFAHAQDGGYPNKPIRIIAPYPPGGTTDLIARSVGEHLTKAWGQPVIVDNRAGAAGMIGATYVKGQPADGYTLIIGSAALYSVNPHLYKNVQYDPVKDFTPIALVASLPSFFVVEKDLPVTSFQEFVAYARRNPGKISYGSAGTGTAQHILVELLKQQAGIDMIHVPYKGSAPAMQDLIGGQVQAACDFGPSTLPFIAAGKVKVLAVTTAKRSPALPNVPTLAESGVPGFDAATWFAIHGPAGMPPEVVTKLNREIVKALSEPEVKARFEKLGVEPTGSTSRQLLDTQVRDSVKWAQVIKNANITVE